MFSKIGRNRYASPTGRTYTLKQVRAHNGTGKVQREAKPAKPPAKSPVTPSRSQPV